MVTLISHIIMIISCVSKNVLFLSKLFWCPLLSVLKMFGLFFLSPAQFGCLVINTEWIKGESSWELVLNYFHEWWNLTLVCPPHTAKTGGKHWKKSLGNWLSCHLPQGVRLTLLLLHFSGAQEITALGKAYLRFSKTLDIGASKE